MRTEQDVRREVMRTVLDRTDRSIEMTIEAAVKAGIEFERARIRAILQISPPPGLEKAMIVLALNAETTVEAAEQFIATWRVDSGRHSANLRRTFRLVSDNSEPAKVENV
ncbi:hypothetical protein ACVIGA_000913 [Bradyrhizobium sp. USDA 3240]